MNSVGFQHQLVDCIEMRARYNYSTCFIIDEYMGRDAKPEQQTKVHNISQNGMGFDDMKSTRCKGVNDKHASEINLRASQLSIEVYVCS